MYSKEIAEVSEAHSSLVDDTWLLFRYLLAPDTGCSEEDQASDARDLTDDGKRTQANQLAVPHPSSLLDGPEA